MIKELGMGIVLVAASGCANSAGEKEAAGVPVVSESQPGATTTTTVIPLEEPTTTEAPAPTTTHTHAPRPTITYPPSTAPPSSSALASIRACESGGDYSTNTGNGYYGAYQFSLSTWQSVGGSGYPHLASPAEQDMRAQIMIDRGRRGEWPNC